MTKMFLAYSKVHKKKSVHNSQKKNRGRVSSILTAQTWNFYTMTTIVLATRARKQNCLLPQLIEKKNFSDPLQIFFFFAKMTKFKWSSQKFLFIYLNETKCAGKQFDVGLRYTGCILSFFTGKFFSGIFSYPPMFTKKNRFLGTFHKKKSVTKTRFLPFFDI